AGSPEIERPALQGQLGIGSQRQGPNGAAARCRHLNGPGPRRHIHGEPLAALHRDGVALQPQTIDPEVDLYLGRQVDPEAHLALLGPQGTNRTRQEDLGTAGILNPDWRTGRMPGRSARSPQPCPEGESGQDLERTPGHPSIYSAFKPIFNASQPRPRGRPRARRARRVSASGGSARGRPTTANSVHAPGGITISRPTVP